MRFDGRNFDELRSCRLEADFSEFAEGSVLIRMGKTVVLCNASVSETVPPYVKHGGWVTAEYSMLPRANRSRSNRDISNLKLASRSAEIQRLIGRSLRASIDLDKLGPRTITIDCDVLQGDGGTRTASVTGGFAAMALACKRMVANGLMEENPIRYPVAAVSAGIVNNEVMLDLCYREDSHADADINCVMNPSGEIIEIQGTGEGRAFTKDELLQVMGLCEKGIRELIMLQEQLLEVTV